MRHGLGWVVCSILVLSLTACAAVGRDRWRDARTLEVNRGANRYIYHLTQLTPAARTSGARPVVTQPPAGAIEVGVITMAAELSGWGAAGLRSVVSEFYDELSALAALLGGTHFVIAMGGTNSGYVTNLTVSVLRAPADAVTWGSVQQQVATPAAAPAPVTTTDGATSGGFVPFGLTAPAAAPEPAPEPAPSP